VTLILLGEAGLINAIVPKSRDDEQVIPNRLTWQGHEFLDASRDDKAWETVKSAMDKSGGFVFEVAKQILLSLSVTAAKQY
jgi:hypothetical protein